MKLSSKHQVVIPKSVRTKLHLSSGDELVIEQVTATSVVLKKAPSFYDFIGSLPARDDDPAERISKLRDEWR